MVDPLGDPLEFHRLMSRHPGRVAAHRWEAWKIVQSAMERNHFELLSVLEKPLTDWTLALELVRNVGATSIQPAYTNEVFRVLHNYLASAKTLVDHSRIHISAYEGSAFADEYGSRVAAMAHHPVVTFVQKLRNVLLHQGLPQIEKVLSGSSGAEFSFSVNFHREALLAIGGWSLGARQYLEDQADSFPIAEPVRQYGEHVGELSDWLHHQLIRIHGPEIDAYNALVQQSRTWDETH